MTALIFSYFLPDPSPVELAKRFESDSSRRPKLSFITVGSRHNIPTRPILEKCIYSFSSRYRKKEKPSDFLSTAFGFQFVFTGLYSPRSSAAVPGAVIPLTETPVTPGRTGRLSLWFQSPSESCQVMSVSRLNLTLTAPSVKATLVTSCKKYTIFSKKREKEKEKKEKIIPQYTQHQSQRCIS